MSGTSGLDITASVLAIVSLAFNVGLALLRLLTTLRDASAEIDSIHVEITITKDQLEPLFERIHRNMHRTQDRHNVLENELRNFLDGLHKLDARLHQCSFSRWGLRGRLSSIIMWTLRRQAVISSLEQLRMKKSELLISQLNYLITYVN